MGEESKEYFKFIMRIGIILHPYGEKNPGGLARVIFEWTRALLERDRENEYIIFLKEKPKDMPMFSGNNWKVEILGSGLFWQDRLRNHTKADVYLFNTPVLPFLYKPKKCVVIAQDFPYLYMPARGIKKFLLLRFVRWYHRWSLRRADAIVAISESTKQDCIRFFGIPKEKITVIYQGFKKICAVPEESIPLPEKFFLFAAAIKERKNVLNIVRAYALFHQKNRTHKLVIAGRSGGGGYAHDIERFIKERGIEKNVVCMGHLSDAKLSYVYRRAEALVFPSLIEGFGLPVVEAMDCGLPVITSNKGGPSELGRDGAALLVDPESPEDIARAMEKISADTELRGTLIRTGKERAESITWENAASVLLGLLRSLL